jgi:plastocyanin
MTKRLRALLIGALLTFGLAACADNASESTTPPSPTAEASEPAESEAPASEPAESEAAASEERVRIDNSTFDPEELTIAAGTEVQWVNADSFGHTVTEGTDGQAVDDPIVDEEIAQNGTVSVTFEEPGTYNITCKIHPSMNMTITVEG